MRQIHIRRWKDAAWREIPFSAWLLFFCALAGVFAGYAVAGDCAVQMKTELAPYWDAILGASDFSLPAFLRTLWCYLRAPLAAFLLGFASIAAVLLPLLCAAQGFLLSLSFFSMAGMLGTNGFPAILALFSLRILLILPCTLCVAVTAWERSRTVQGKRRKIRSLRTAASGRREIFCLLCLTLGAFTELWLLPRLLPAMVGG